MNPDSTHPTAQAVAGVRQAGADTPMNLDPTSPSMSPTIPDSSKLSSQQCDAKDTPLPTASLSTLRQHPTELINPVIESDENENENETSTASPNEPITPVDANSVSNDCPAVVSSELPASSQVQQNHQYHNQKQTAPIASTPSAVEDFAKGITPPTISSPIFSADQKGDASIHPPVPDQEDNSNPPSSSVSRRSTVTTRRPSHSFKRSVTNLFKRTNSSSQSVRPDMSYFDSPQYGGSSETAATTATTTTPNGNSGPPPTQARQSSYSMGNSMGNSYATTRSNSPPTPGSPGLEMTSTQKTVKPQQSPMPGPDDFNKKTNRASTGLTLRGRAINFVHSGSPGRDKQSTKKRHVGRRRSFESEKAPVSGHEHSRHAGQIEPSPWPQIADAGVGVKARRLSISLPDDFHVEVADLTSEYEYQNKLFGRHGKHLGKGATSKVTLMGRKGFPGELYAVKEFRNKSKAESSEDYEKKVKSEFSIAKSLHHPNIVETVQLCVDHGRWNHVMEYCSDGDLYQLVEKGYLKHEQRASDRLCLFKQVIQGVNYLHTHGIAHRDIKLENCLISNGSKLKITDFGVSEVFTGTHPGLREAAGQCGQNMDEEIRLCSPGICGSEPYIAPEVISKQGRYDPRGMDVWGSAVIMIYLTFGANIWKRAESGSGNVHYDLLVKQWDKWNAKHKDDPKARISDSDYPYYLPFDEFVSPPALRRVLLMMLNPDPAKRASISEIANHRWVKNIECCQLDSYDDPAQYIDASKKDATRVNGQKKIFCHNHLPMQSHGHSLGKMPGQSGY